MFCDIIDLLQGERKSEFTGGQYEQSMGKG